MMIDPTQMLDEIKDLQHRLHESIHRNAEHTEKILELQNRIAELEKQSEHWKMQYVCHAESLDVAEMRLEEMEAQLQKSQRKSRQLYAALEGAKRIASEYYAFGLTGFEGDYTQIVNQLNDGLPEVEG